MECLPMNAPKEDDLERLAVPLWPTAGKALGLSRNTTYAAAQRGDIPTLRFGRLVRVPLKALQRLLDGAGKE
jgi:excisionase family DNA binding protein